MKGIDNRQPYDIAIEKKVEIVVTLFITGRDGESQETPWQQNVNSFTLHELQEPIKSTKCRKAARPDEIPSEAMKEAAKIQSERLHALLKTQSFSKSRRSAKAALMLKEGKDPKLPRS